MIKIKHRKIKGRTRPCSVHIAEYVARKLKCFFLTRILNVWKVKGTRKRNLCVMKRKVSLNCEIIVDTVFFMTGKSIVAKFMSIDLQDAAFTQWYTMKRRE